ncbi:MAG: hypothetical protein QOJ53_854, partial [Sphingomonadales bacterium]|nr:hypothetical protein [Sphingomonadales bacterium]
MLGSAHKKSMREALHQPLHLPDASAAADAAELIARFGVYAASEASARGGPVGRPGPHPLARRR